MVGRGNSSSGTQMTNSSFLAWRRPCSKPMVDLSGLSPRRRPRRLVFSSAPLYAPLPIREDVSHLPWLPRVSPLRSWEQKSRVAVPSFHIKLGSLPSALGRMEQHSVMAIEKELERDSVPGRWVLPLWLTRGWLHSRHQQKPSQAMCLRLLISCEEPLKASKNKDSCFSSCW